MDPSDAPTSGPPSLDAADRADAAALVAAGEALLAQGDAQAASERFHAALAADPRQAGAYLGLGRALEARGKLALAILRYQAATALAPGSADAFVALGDAYMAQGKAKPALSAYDRALRADPKCGRAHYHEALTHLALGSYGRGWRGYDWRRRAAAAGTTESALPAWDGKPRDGLKLLVYDDGDAVEAIVFAHVLGDLLATGAQVFFRGDDGLAALLRRSFPSIETVGAAASPPAVDAAIALGGLPGHFRRRKPDFNRPPSYLVADLRATTSWRERHGTRGAGPKLGLAWHGEARWPAQNVPGPTQGDLAPFFDIPGLQAIDLSDRPSPLPADAAAPGLDVDQLAARVDATDLVVAVPGLVAALAGALGKPVWLLAPAVTGWLWLLKGRKLPWFPTMVVRRLRPGQAWRAAATALAAELRAGVGADHLPPLA